jgi:hypothetical protein
MLELVAQLGQIKATLRALSGGKCHLGNQDVAGKICCELFFFP